MPNPNVDWSGEDIPNFEVPEEFVAFPAGYYTAAIGKLKAVYPKDSSGEVPPDAVVHTLWILKYHGSEDAPADKPRIVVKDGVVTIPDHGAVLFERYPNPVKMPKLAFRARAFFGKLDCISEVGLDRFDAEGKPIVKKVVDWTKVKAKYGSVIRFAILYREGKDGKSYRNIQYETIADTGLVLQPIDMMLIEKAYESKKEAQGKVPDEKDIPF